MAACAPMLAPRGIANDTAAFADNYLLARDGEKLPSRSWGPDRPKAVVVALHGMGDYSNAFVLPGEDWAKAGIVTLAYDQRGFGASPNPGMWGGGDAMRRDLADALDAARAKYPGVPVYALGESMGGAVVLSAFASADPPKADGIILIAPAVWSRSDMPLSYRVTLWLAAHTMPSISFSGRGIVQIWPSDNIPMLRAYSRDPLVQKATRSDAVYGLVNLMDDGRHAPEHLTAPPPIALFYGKHDQVIPNPPTEAVIAALGDKAEIHVYEHGFHMLMRDLDGATVRADVLAWIEKQPKR